MILVVLVLILTLSVWAFSSALLLKMGKLKPRTCWGLGLQTPLGGLFWGIGFLSLGLANEMEASASVEIVAQLMFIVGFGGGLWVEGRALKAREACSEAHD